MSSRLLRERRVVIEERLDTVTWIESPEQVRFEYRIAGPARRGLAYAFDLVIKGGVLLLLGFLLFLGGFKFNGLAGWTMGLFIAVLFVLEWGYGVLFESLMSGQTPGKRMMKLRVIKEEGYPINFMDALLRNLLRAADFLPAGYALGAAMMSVDPRFRRLGDLVAGTIVIIEDASHLGESVSLRQPATPEELAAMPAARLSREEREALDLFVRRLRRLGPARADELAEIVLPRFSAALPASAGECPSRALALLYLRAAGKRSAASPKERAMNHRVSTPVDVGVGEAR